MTGLSISGFPEDFSPNEVATGNKDAIKFIDTLPSSSKIISKRWLIYALIGLGAASVTLLPYWLKPAPVWAAGPPGQTQQLTPPEIVLQADPRYFPARVPPPPLRDDGPGIQGVPFVVNYNPSSCGASVAPWPAAAQAAFSYAATIWSTLLDSSQTVTIDACWSTALPVSTLGSARADLLYGIKVGSNTSWYPSALANQLVGYDINPARSEILANFNANRANWYFGTDTNAGGNQYDLATVVLHEIGHGLGFSGSMRVDDGVSPAECSGVSGQGCWGFSAYPNTPQIYDRFAENGSGQQLIDTGTFPNPSTALGSQLTGDNLYFDGSNTRGVNGGNPAQLYAPNTWRPGSSFSHLGENFNNSSNALMTYSLFLGEVAHHPGPVTLGILQDLGWPTVAGAELLVDKSVSTTLVSDAGERLIYTIDVYNGGTLTANNLVITDVVPGSTALDPTSLSGDATYSGTASGSLITWNTGQSLAQGQALARSFEVTTAVGVAQGTVIANSAVVSATNLSESRASNTVVSVADGAGCNFFDDFEAGPALGPYWRSYTTNDGRIRVAYESSPVTYAHSGNRSVWLDDAVGGGTFSYAAIILNSYLASESQVDLDFWWYTHDDEQHPDDGVFLSDDGGLSWTKVYSFTKDNPDIHQHATLDIDALATGNGLNLNNNFEIKFQFYDNFPFISDGYAIDDVQLTCGTTAITLEQLTATAGSEGVTVHWETGTEIDNAGFNLYRAATEAGPFFKLNQILLPARGTATEGAGYSYVDRAAAENVIYYYKLEDVDLNGESTLHGPVSSAAGLSTAPAPDSSLYLPIVTK